MVIRGEIKKRLKPCPFCGGNKIDIIGTDRYWIVCSECGCEGPAPATLHENIETMVTAWNTRRGI